MRARARTRPYRVAFDYARWPDAAGDLVRRVRDKQTPPSAIDEALGQLAMTI